MSHDPTVTAAVTTVVGAGGVAIVSFLTTAWSTRRTLESSELATQRALEGSAEGIKAAARAEREHALWQKRVDVYKRLIGHFAEQPSLVSNPDLVQSLASGFKDASWADLYQDLILYGSEEVRQVAASLYVLPTKVIAELANLKEAPSLEEALKSQRTVYSKIQVEYSGLIGRLHKLVREETQAVL